MSMDIDEWRGSMIDWLVREITEALTEVRVLPNPPDELDGAVHVAMQGVFLRRLNIFEKLVRGMPVSEPAIVADLAEQALTAAFTAAAQKALAGTPLAGFATVRLVLVKPYRPFGLMGEIDGEEKTQEDRA